jgi:hypothetical protein
MHYVRGIIKQGFVKCDNADLLEQGAKAWGTLHHGPPERQKRGDASACRKFPALHPLRYINFYGPCNF